MVTIYWPKDRIICNRNGHVKSEVMNSDDQKAQVLYPNAVTAAARESVNHATVWYGCVVTFHFVSFFSYFLFFLSNYFLFPVLLYLA